MHIHMHTTIAHVRPERVVLVRPYYRTGLLTGLVAGMALSVVLMAQTTLLMGLDPWAATKMAWSLLAGPDVVRPGFELLPVVGGTLVHFGLSALYGLAFAWLAIRSSTNDVVLGVFLGVALYALNVLALPSIFPGRVGHMFALSPGMHALSLAEHGFFGVLLGIVYRLCVVDERRLWVR